MEGVIFCQQISTRPFSGAVSRVWAAETDRESVEIRSLEGTLGHCPLEEILPRGPDLKADISGDTKRNCFVNRSQ